MVVCAVLASTREQGGVITTSELRKGSLTLEVFRRCKMQFKGAISPP